MNRRPKRNKGNEREPFLDGSSNENKISWIAWDKVTSPRSKGGLGIGSLKVSNQSLLAKWWWRIRNEEHALWSKVIRSLHGPMGCLAEDSTNTISSGPWPQIKKLKFDLKQWINLARPEPLNGSLPFSVRCTGTGIGTNTGLRYGSGNRNLNLGWEIIRHNIVAEKRAIFYRVGKKNEPQLFECKFKQDCSFHCITTTCKPSSQLNPEASTVDLSCSTFQLLDQIANHLFCCICNLDMMYRAMFPSVTRLLKWTNGISRRIHSSFPVLQSVQLGEYSIRRARSEDQENEKSMDEVSTKFAESVGFKVIRTDPTVPVPKIKKVLFGKELKTDRDDLLNGLTFVICCFVPEFLPGERDLDT
ncbi:RNA-directed DNA polymerase, eukaryota, Reverse transcriptase zinc-binding domain protein [Artemisia annua]|uniref:RNA-directed DNA polymerase, eukaryota, Reverse transcriptase zinc-binding domain protein n=1 Tax=Artemisia annua TaxID=35608 RepID=A0A2U1KSS5_ARTAN|nr:RNA-directed DNA polymerase, eukaryota, Reverse transcriptase zinc-binding domain protein [Artemisia annua]